MFDPADRNSQIKFRKMQRTASRTRDIRLDYARVVGRVFDFDPHAVAAFTSAQFAKKRECPCGSLIPNQYRANVAYSGVPLPPSLTTFGALRYFQSYLREGSHARIKVNVAPD